LLNKGHTKISGFSKVNDQKRKRDILHSVWTAAYSNAKSSVLYTQT